MKNFIILSLCSFIIFQMVQTELLVQVPTNSITPPETVKLNVLSREVNKQIHVSLVPTETFLANENVPVWITSKSSDATNATFISQNIMKEVAPFTVYRDPETCSAALYFHKTKQFEGTIGHHHIIHKLNYNPITKEVEPSEDTVFASPLPKHYQFRSEEDVEPSTVQDRVASLRAYPDTVYVETLVMVNNDITEYFQNDYAAVVTYVLTLFNTVDMLFSKIEIPDIKINIAGIIIGNKPFPEFISGCYRRVERINNEWILALRDRKVFRAIRRTLNDFKYGFPIQSYDIVVFLTRLPIMGRNRSGSTIYGVSLFPKLNYKRRIEDTGLSIVSEPKNFQRFPTVAHEIAHLLGAPHDAGPLLTIDGECNGNIMRSPGSRCTKCITFGGKTPEYLRTFFGSRDACIFHNKPRSLNDPGHPQLFWTPHEQCECYGYESVYIRRNCFPIPPIFPHRVNCKSYLKCVDDDEMNHYHYTNVYMDGTPCAKRAGSISVCWDNKCVPLQK